MADSTSIPIIVQGNSFDLAIPLQIYYINGDQMDLQDYTPDPTDKVSIQLKGTRRQYTYSPTITGNTAYIELSGNEMADNYGVVVSIVKADGSKLRSFRTDQFFIVESSDDLTMDDIIAGLEENVIYLNSQAFVAGEDGRGIESIDKTSTAGLVDTYTITYSDNTTSTFDVTNGATGQDGEQGADGVGITSIEKTSTVGLVDTYTITLSNGDTTTFDVTNGKDGVDLGLAEIVNDLTTGGSTKVLSAEMGKYLAQDILGGEGIRETIPCNALSIKGGYYSSSNSGQIVSSNSYKYTNKINISNILRIDVTGAYQTKVLFWGEDGTTYLGYTSTAVVKKEDFPTGAAYCAMNYADTSTANIVIDYSFEPYILDIQKGGLGYAKLVLPIGKYNLTASTGEQAYDSNWNGVLGFVPLYGAISVYVPENGSAQGVICFYDENFTYLEGSAYTQYKIVPSGAKYCKIRVASGTLAYTNVDVYLYGAKLEPLNAFENTRKAIGKISPKCLIGKTVAFLGDSITAANLYGLYTRRFADISGATITNYAVGGKCYAGDEIAGQAASLTGTEDVVVMMGGTNDFNQSKVIGDIYVESGGTITAPSSSTFCGGLHDAIQAVYAKCPTAQVVIITPPQKSNGWTVNTQGKYLFEYADAIIKVAQLYAIPVVDQFANCGINPVMSAMKSAYFNNDGTHPNNTYHMLLAQWLYNAIATWVKEPYN